MSVLKHAPIMQSKTMCSRPFLSSLLPSFLDLLLSNFSFPPPLTRPVSQSVPPPPPPPSQPLPPTTHQLHILSTSFLPDHLILPYFSPPVHSEFIMKLHSNLPGILVEPSQKQTFSCESKTPPPSHIMSFFLAFLSFDDLPCPLSPLPLPKYIL